MRLLATVNYGFRELFTGYRLEVHKIFEQIDTFTLTVTYLSLLWNHLAKDTLEGCFDPSEDSGPSRKRPLRRYQIAKMLYCSAYHAFPG